MARDLIQQEAFASVQEVQAGVSRLLHKAQDGQFFIRVIKNSKPIGVLMPNVVFENIIEDMLAMASPTYLRNIKKARKEKKRYSALAIKQQLGI